MPFINENNLSKEELLALVKHNKDIYYHTKRLANYSDDYNYINGLWEKSIFYWKQAEDIELFISKM